MRTKVFRSVKIVGALLGKIVTPCRQTTLDLVSGLGRALLFSILFGSNLRFWHTPKYTGTSYWIIAAVLYALAKLLEFYDEEVYSVGSILSGHTVKHFAAAAACFAILRYYQTRQPLS